MFDYKLDVLWLERSVDGSAARAHLDGTLARLELAGFNEVRVHFNDADPDGSESPLRKARRLLSLSVKAAARARPNRILFARFHPFLLPVELVWRAVSGTVVLSVQGSLEDVGAPGNSRFARLRLVKWASIAGLRLSDRLIVGNPTIREHIAGYVPGHSVEVIPNGVFVQGLQESEATTRPRNGPYAVYVGNFASWQGVETLLEATLSSSWPADLPLVIVGDGSMRDLVSAAVSEKVIWVGRQPSEKARAWLAHAEFAFSLKRSDTPTAQFGYWPFKMLESAALGVPIIVSDATGMPEAAAELGNALVVPSEDPAAAAEAAKQLYDNPDLRMRMGNQGRVNIKQYDWSTGAPALKYLLLGSNP